MITELQKSNVISTLTVTFFVTNSLPRCHYGPWVQEDGNFMPHVSLLHSYGVFQCLCYADGDPELRRQEARVSAFDDIVAGFR
ncbi:hypothetical protein NPIL_174131 [Nephila pilipes]|uniref:Uncharacterized protein n=1 Tax=Nephila pilipes TaxID=299642 RepID=A0A8X6N7G2_NEPPI|nr:hypothetical protein NPIL_174131 [Nephila pilipes]